MRGGGSTQSAGVGGQYVLTRASIFLSAAIALSKSAWAEAGRPLLPAVSVWISSSRRTTRPGMTAAYVEPPSAPLVCAWTRPSAAGAGGSAAWTTLTRRLRRMIAVLRTSFTLFCSEPVVSGYIPTAAVAALYWLVNTLNTAVGLSAIVGPVGPSLLCARIQRLRYVRPRCELRTRLRARLTNFTFSAVFAEPSSAGAAGGWAIRYLAP